MNPDPPLKLIQTSTYIHYNQFFYIVIYIKALFDIDTK